MKDSLNKLVGLKIPALGGKDAETNGMILELLALEASQTVWGINKLLRRSRERYPTIFRAVKRLKKRGYVAKTGTIKMAKKKERTPVYGLTWRGFIASLTSEKVCSDVLNALEKNPQLEFPFPRDAVLPIIRALFSDEEIEKLAKSLFECFIRIIPYNIEERVPDGYLVATLTELLPIVSEAIKQKDLSILFKHPKFVNWADKTLEERIKDWKEGLQKLEEYRKYIEPFVTKATG